MPLPAYVAALAIKSDWAEAHSNLGNVLTDLGRPDDAVASYRHRTQASSPRSRQSTPTWGMHYGIWGTTTTPSRSYCAALRIKPEVAAIHSNMGNALRDLGRLDDAGRRL